jgi:phosphatidylglycerophosphatase A
MNAFILWVAQGFGIGRIPVASGTFGSIVGLGWFALLLSAQHYWVFLIGAFALTAFSVWGCGVAEKILEQTDPSSVVLDEIVAVPLCFIGWLSILYWRDQQMVGPAYFFGPQRWLGTFAVLVAFRVFDILKPWPVRQSQILIGGLGITMDDVIAAFYVNALTLIIFAARSFST